MTQAVCFRCGADKVGAFAKCPACSAVPSTNEQLESSLILCEHISSKQQLEACAAELRSGLKLVLGVKARQRAREALRDSHLMSVLGLPAAGERRVDRSDSSEGMGTARPANSDENVPSHDRNTSLHRNPFAILGATTRDDRRRLVELAESRALEGDHDLCHKARADLTNPRTRLSAEIAWLPGVSPKRASQLLSELRVNAHAIRRATGLPSLAHANLLAAMFETLDVSSDDVDLAECIGEFAAVVEELNVEDILRDIDEDRAVSGFPRLQAASVVEDALAERKRYYRDAVKAALNKLSAQTLVEVMTRAVEEATASGETHAPALLDEVVDSYELEAQEFLQNETENVRKLIERIRGSASSGENAIRPLVDRLESVVRNWDRIAQPIQLSAKARGIEHEPSRNLALEIRSLGVDLFNHHDLLEPARRITALLQGVFAEVPEVFDRVEQDASAIEEITESREQAERDREQFARQIMYEADIGLVFKDKLRISPDGIEWKGSRFPLESITRVRWGGVRHSINGVPTGTTYTIAVGDNRSETLIELKREEIFSAFLERLWPAVCARLMFEHLQALKSGQDIRMGEATIRDHEVELTRHKFFGANERVRCTWHQVQVWSTDGSFFIGAKEDRKTYAQLSYIETANTHILEQLIRIAFKKPFRNLSDAFDKA